MSAAEILEQFRQLPFEEQRALVERLNEELADDLTSEQMAELERRAENLRRHPERGVPWETVRAELNGRLKKDRPCPGA